MDLKPLSPDDKQLLQSRICDESALAGPLEIALLDDLAKALARLQG